MVCDDHIVEKVSCQECVDAPVQPEPGPSTSKFTRSRANEETPLKWKNCEFCPPKFRKTTKKSCEICEKAMCKDHRSEDNASYYIECMDLIKKRRL